MSKYSTELKVKVVKAHQNNEGGYRNLADKYGISNGSIVRKWVNIFKAQGYDGLKVSRKNKNYSFEYKKNIVKFYLTGEMSYQELANQFKINNPSMITRWVKEFREEGFDGLRPKKRGRPSSMTKDKKTPKKEYTEEEIDEINKLKEELYWTQMEIDFLKKKMELEDKDNQKMIEWLE